MTISFHDGKVLLYPGDCMAILPMLGDNSVDAVVTDPPYHLTSIVKRFGAANAAPAKTKQTGAFARASRGFMGCQWDGGDIAFTPELWAEVLRVLKPGGHMAAFGGTRTYHRMAYAIEDAGFEIRDTVSWNFGTGFPKSHDIGKRLDASGERCVCKSGDNVRNHCDRCGKPIVPDGLGTALKPAMELICLARKPLSERTVAANVLKWGTGAINIEACLIPVGESDQRDVARQITRNIREGEAGWGMNGRAPQSGVSVVKPEGRFPANLIHDGSPEVLASFPANSKSGSAVSGNEPSKAGGGVAFGVMGRVPFKAHNDNGSAARFFYHAKASADDRLGSMHPTIKPVALIRWLARLITPPNGIILDPFAGTGTTAAAAFREGMRAILIEREPEYQLDIGRRMDLLLSGSTESRGVSAVQDSHETLALFGVAA